MARGKPRRQYFDPGRNPMPRGQSLRPTPQRKDRGGMTEGDRERRLRAQERRDRRRQRNVRDYLNDADGE